MELYVNSPMCFFSHYVSFDIHMVICITMVPLIDDIHQKSFVNVNIVIIRFLVKQKFNT